MTNWDKRYGSSAKPLFGEGPNEYVREICARADFQARSALCLADGDGRNGRWLASLGLAVTAVDLSPVATQLAIQRDNAAGVSVERIVGDLAEWTPPERLFEAVFVIFLQCELSVRTRALKVGVEALKPGGWIIVEGFSKAQASAKDIGPKDTSVLYDLEEVEKALPDLEIVEAFTGRALLQEGVKHNGVGEIIRFTARKPQ